MEYDGERPELGRLAGSNSIGPGARVQGCTEIGQKIGRGRIDGQGFEEKEEGESRVLKEV